MNKSIRLPSSYQSGVVLLDALVAIVIFSIGILGMVAMQASAIKLSTDANYRTSAAMLTDQLIGQMWTSGDPSTLATNYNGTSSSSGGTLYKAWLATLDCSAASTVRVTTCLPGVNANPPTVTVTNVVASSATKNAQYQVAIRINWQVPPDQTSQSDSGPHNYVSVTNIGL